MQMFPLASAVSLLTASLALLAKANSKRFRVWLVDDREENRKNFRANHGSDFDIRVFENPDEVLLAIKTERAPDAVLCDIYFYDDPRRREEVETRVKEQADRLRELASELGADKAQDGIGLIANIRAHFGGAPPFPIYAYTSKGPYLLQSDRFDRLEELSARWLFKNKYSPQTERGKIRKDIEEFRERYEWPKRLWSVAWRTGLIMAISGSFLGVVLDRLARYLGF